MNIPMTTDTMKTMTAVIATATPVERGAAVGSVVDKQCGPP